MNNTTISLQLILASIWVTSSIFGGQPPAPTPPPPTFYDEHFHRAAFLILPIGKPPAHGSRLPSFPVGTPPPHGSQVSTFAVGDRPPTPGHQFSHK
jgi:hypothetical protein